MPDEPNLPAVIDPAQTADRPTLEIGWTMSAFHGKLRKARRARGLTQRQLADIFDVTASTIGGIERLVLKPDKELRDQLADFLGLTADNVWPEWLEAQPMPLRAVAYQEVTVEVFSTLALEVRKRVLEIEDRSYGLDEHMERVILRENIDKVLRTLTKRERQVIELRFGLTGPAHTLEECSEVMGVTRERVRQIEITAFRKLRQEERNQPMQKIDKARNNPDPEEPELRDPHCVCGHVYGIARYCNTCGCQGCGACLSRGTVDGGYVYFCQLHRPVPPAKRRK